MGSTGKSERYIDDIALGVGSAAVDAVGDAAKGVKAVDAAEDAGKGVRGAKGTGKYKAKSPKMKDAKVKGWKKDYKVSIVKLFDKLTAAQKSAINKLDNIIENNLTKSDFSGTLADLQGKPIPKPGGGFWDHLTEMKQSYKGLNSARKSIEGSLKNPNLSPQVKKFLQSKLAEVDSWISKIEDLFRPFGGIK